MARGDSIDDSTWVEVGEINNYAMFMGHLLMGVRGLGLLLLTWSTVVLLGGFVSVLQKKDFWSLTVITLVQTAGVFDFLLREKFRDVINSIVGLLVAVGSTFIRPSDKYPSIAREALGLGLLMVQLILFAILLCPLALLYIFGLYISTGVSLWRLIEHDYGNTGEDANLKSALDVLYCLAVAQGLLFGYRAIYIFGTGIGQANHVARVYSLDSKIVSDYLIETVLGCTKDPSFGRGRNLVTYATDMMIESKSRESYLLGVRILGTIIGLNKTVTLERSSNEESMLEQWILIKQLLTGSTSFTHIIQKLMETMGPRSPYSTEIKRHAARIVVHIASDIRLEQFPQGVQCLSSLLDTFEVFDWLPSLRYWQLSEHYERPWLLEPYELDYLRKAVGQRHIMPPESDINSLDGYKELVVQGLVILWKLADDEDNCRIICSTQGLLSKVTAPLISGIHHDHPEEWSEIAEVSMELISRLMAAPGETGTKLRCEISSNKEAIRTMQCILKCDICGAEQQKQAVGILLDLSIDTSSIMPNGDSGIIFIKTLLDLFLFGMIKVHQSPSRFRKMISRYYSFRIHLMKKRTYNTNFAGEKLLAMLASGSEIRSATLILQAAADDKIVGIITTTIIVVKNKTHRMRAAQIVKHLCSHYTSDDEYLRKLKEEMTYVMREVLIEILGYGSIEEIKAVKEANDTRFLTSGTDLEEGGVSQDTSPGNDSSSHRQKRVKHEDNKLQETLVSLCRVICDRWINVDPELARQFNEITEKICLEQGKPVKDFTLLVEEAHDLVNKNRTQEMATAIGHASSSSGT